MMQAKWTGVDDRWIMRVDWRWEQLRMLSGEMMRHECDFLLRDFCISRGSAT
jgi:hypothetical protein